MFRVDVVTLFPEMFASGDRPLDLRARAGARRSSTSRCTTSSTPSAQANGPTTGRTAAARAWSCGSSRWRASSTRSSPRRRPASAGPSIVTSPGRAALPPGRRRTLRRPRPADHRLRPLRGHRRTAGAALRRRGAARSATSCSPGGEIPALAFLDATVRLLDGRAQPGVAGERNRSPTACSTRPPTPGRRRFGDEASRRSCSRATTPRSPPGDASSPGRGPPPGARTWDRGRACSRRDIIPGLSPRAPGVTGLRMLQYVCVPGKL